MPRRCSTSPGARCAGFSVLGLALSVLLLGVAAALLLPALRREVSRHRQDTTIDDLRGFAGAFQAYARDHGDWPAAIFVPGAVPPGMEKYLAATNWTKPSPIGGRYEWLRHTPQNGGRYNAVIAIVPAGAEQVSGEREPLAGIDRGIDDGDLTAGSFFLGFQEHPVYVLEH